MELNHRIVTCLFDPAFDFWRGGLISLKKVFSPIYDSLTSSEEGALRIVNPSCKPGFVPLIQAPYPSNAVGRDSLETLFIQEGNIYPGSHWFQKGHLCKGSLVYC